MCDPNLLHMTKAVLLQLLNSQHRGYYTIPSLDDEFFSCVGYLIPYYDLGYRYLETFFQSIPDVLWIDPLWNVYPSNWGNRMHSNNVPAYYNAPVPSNFFQPERLPWNPRVIKWSTYNRTKRNPVNCSTYGNVDVEENDIVDADPGLSDRNTADSEGPISNQPDTPGSPPYSEIDMENVAGANCNDNLNSLPQRYGAIPYFIAHDDPIPMIGSKFSHKRYGVIPETINVESKMQVGQFYELYISEVNSPYKFWFQLVEDEYYVLSALEKQLNTFYNTSLTHSDDLIDEIHMAKGYSCAALYNQQWSRAEFIGRPEDSKVKLFFVDYGTVAKVSTRDIRYLLNTFCKLPRSCFRGTLDFIKPTHNRWNDEATNHFSKLIREVKLIAGVSEINTKDNSVRIYVMDRSKSSIVNCKLVEDGYAFPEDPRDRCQNHIADIFSTFDALEKGEYPSLTEMVEYSVQGIDAAKMFDKKIIDGVDCYVSPFMSNDEAMETIQKFYREKEKAKEIASKRDATTFMRFFERMLTNPFLNGKAFRVDEMKNVSSTNPFTPYLDDSTDLIQ